MAGTERRRTLCLIACEPSGDETGARLAAAVRLAAPDVRLVGAGGPAMAVAGVEVAVHTTALPFMGLLGSVRIMRRLVGVFRRVQRLVVATRPDLVVLIDSETVTLPFAVWLRRRGVPAVFFFPPQVWFWSRWRLPTIVPLLRRVLSAFREEAELYRAAGADAHWVGHPLRDHVRVDEDPAAVLRALGLDPARPLVVLMPGSRRHEVKAHLGPLLGAARLLQAREPRLQFALPLALEALRPYVEPGVRASGVRDVAVYLHRSYAVLSRAEVVLQCAGTATLEAALLGVPAVILYRCNRIEYAIGRRLVCVPYIGMVNILLGEMVQPELLQRRVTAEGVAAEAWALLTDPARRRAVRARLAGVRDLLGPPGACRRAAAAVVELLPVAAEATGVEFLEEEPPSLNPEAAPVLQVM